MTAILDEPFGSPTAGTGTAFGSCRQVCKITGGALDQIRVTFRQQTTTRPTTQMSHCSIGISNGNEADCTASPIELTFNGGQHGFNIPADATITSDWVSLTGFTAASRLVVIMDAADSAATGIIGYVTGRATEFGFDLYSSPSYNIAAAPPGFISSFTNSGVLVGVTMIEVQSAGGSGTPVIGDKRESILSQLVTICGGVEGINAVDRNRLDVAEMLRPAVIVLDGAERLALGQPPSTRHATVSEKQSVELRPLIIIALRGNSGGEAGALASLFRNRVVAAILNDTTLRDSVTTNGGIRYEGCVVQPPDAEAREYRIDLNLVFTYVWSLSDFA